MGNLEKDKMNELEKLYDKLSSMNFVRHHAHLEAFLEFLEKGNAATLCLIEAAHYKHLAQIDGIREEAKKESEYFLKKAIEYEGKTSNNEDD